MTDEEIVEEHAEWTGEFFKWVFRQAMLHGIKHGRELERKEVKE